MAYMSFLCVAGPKTGLPYNTYYGGVNWTPGSDAVPASTGALSPIAMHNMHNIHSFAGVLGMAAMSWLHLFTRQAHTGSGSGRDPTRPNSVPCQRPSCWTRDTDAVQCMDAGTLALSLEGT